MMWPTAKLAEVSPALPIKRQESHKFKSVWQLTLDHIESNSGRLLKVEEKSVQQLGSSTHGFDQRHVLYSKLRPNLNKVHLPSKQGFGTTELVPLLPDDDVLDRRYLAYYLRSEKFVNWISGHTIGAKMPRVNMKVFWEHEIPLPPLPEQKRIAAILDAADALRQKDQQLIDRYNDLSQSLFLDMFGDPILNEKKWSSKKLGELCGVGSSKRVFVKDLIDAGVPFYRGQEIGQLSEGKNIQPTLFITPNHYEDLKGQSGVPKKGDLLLPSICPDGRIYQLQNEHPFYFKDGRVLWIKVNADRVNSTYLKFLLKVVFYANYSNIASGTTFAELKIVALKKIDILCPPLTLQEEFEKRIYLLEKQLIKGKQNFNKSNDLFNCLLQKAFAGELSVV